MEQVGELVLPSNKRTERTVPTMKCLLCSGQVRCIFLAAQLAELRAEVLGVWRKNTGGERKEE